MIRILSTFVILWAGAAQAEVQIKTPTSPGGIAAWVVEEPSIPVSYTHLTLPTSDLV